MSIDEFSRSHSNDAAEDCPFRIGDIVVYVPSARGRGHAVMTGLSKLVPGRAYRVAGIQEATYLVIEGFELRPGGGLHWTEFQKPETGEGA